MGTLGILLLLLWKTKPTAQRPLLRNTTYNPLSLSDPPNLRNPALHAEVAQAHEEDHEEAQMFISPSQLQNTSQYMCFCSWQ